MRVILVILTFFWLISLVLAGTLKYSFENEGLEGWRMGGEKGKWEIEAGELSGEFQEFPSIL